MCIYNGKGGGGKEIVVGGFVLGLRVLTFDLWVCCVESVVR